MDIIEEICETSRAKIETKSLIPSLTKIDKRSYWEDEATLQTPAEEYWSDEDESLAADDLQIAMEGIEKTAIVEGTRSNRKVVRFAEETKHLHPSFGGSAGTNNSFTVGREVDMGHSTEDLTILNAYAKIMQKDRT